MEFQGKEVNAKKTITMTIVILLFIMAIAFGGKIFETNKAGQFQIKQAALTGDMSAIMEPGTYMQLFGGLDTYKYVATIGFGEKNQGEGSADIDAIDVIFNDGSLANISGLVRIELPNDPEMALRLKKEFSMGYDHFIRAGVVPVVRNAVKLSANIRSAQDAYTTLAPFQQDVEDQLRNGMFVTKSDKIKIERSTGETEEQKVTVLVLDDDGTPKRTPNALQLLGCKVTLCVIDVPEFDAKVQQAIAARKDEAMKTELAKQSAIRAKQDALTSEEQGKANVAKAKYEREVEKIKEVTDAQKQFEVGVLKAKQNFEVAQLNAKEAEEKKKATISAGQAEAEASRLKVSAGLSPQERAEWDYKTKVGVATALATVKVPSIVVGGGDGKNGGVSAMDAIGINMLLGITEKLSK